jgi:2-methylcitrate dehydratase PrpD
VKEEGDFGRRWEEEKLPLLAQDLTSIHIHKLTQKLASFCVATRPEDLPVAALESARQLILDTIGVSLLASTHKIGRLISDQVAELGGHEQTASVFGAGDLKVAPVFAALANGTMANALDYDGGGHLPTHILPAVLAVAEESRLSGREALAAFIVAYEAAARLTKVIDAKRAEHQGPTYRGWWHVGLIGPVAAALAACRLKSADAEQTARAIGIATASSAGFRRSMGTMTKALHSGNAARGGIEAAMLAIRGFTGDPEIIEAPLGFVAAITMPNERDATPITERLGRPFVLETSPGVKRYPAVTPSHGVITAALKLAAQGGYAVEDIKKVESDFRTFSLSRMQARDEEEAGFCAPYLIAASLVHGAFGPEQILPAAINDPRVRKLSERVVQIPKTAGEGNVVTLHLHDGKTLSARGRGEHAVEPDFIALKFRQCASAALNASAVEEIRDIVAHLDQHPSLDRLMALARGA